MAGYKLIYGTDSLDIGDGKTYYPGDVVPISEARARALSAAGMLFDGIETAQSSETAAVEMLNPDIAKGGKS